MPLRNLPLRIQQNFSLWDVFYRLADAAGILAAMLAAIAITRAGGEYRLLAAEGAVAFLVMAEVSGLYRNWHGASARRQLGCLLWTWGLALVTLLVVGFLARSAGSFSRLTLLVWATFVPAILSLIRAATGLLQRTLRARGINTRRYAVVGANTLAFDLAQNIEQSPELGLRLVGFYDDRPPQRTPDFPGDPARRIGNIADLAAAAREGRVDIVYITLPMRAEQRIKGVLEELADTTASVYLVPDFFVFQILHSRWTDIGGLPAVSIFENPLYGASRLAKRAVDLVLTTIALAVLAIPMAVIALLIKLTSRGPVFFRQKRYGLDGREIQVWKFRSMTVCENGDNVVQAVRGDARVTRLGAILRKTSLDELPQLFNVLAGNMSLVGPRPHATAHNEAYRKRIFGYMLRHKVKPGITGLAQVSGWRGETDTLEKMANRVACDHRYIREWSLWLDLKILLRTIGVVFSRQNAY